VLDYTVRLCLALQEIAKLLQSGWVILHSHQQGMRVPVAPHPCLHLVLLILFFNSSLSNRCVVVSRFKLQFSNNNVEHLKLICHLYIFW